MPEVAGAAAIGFDPYDVNDLVHKMELLISDENLRNLLIEKGTTRLSDFDWSTSCDELLELFKQVAIT
jgi:glycosyltransferase involved in cell wall biosynthesis